MTINPAAVPRVVTFACLLGLSLTLLYLTAARVEAPLVEAIAILSIALTGERFMYWAGRLFVQSGEPSE
jgi:hypothetical protein